MSHLPDLFEEKIKVLESFLRKTTEYRDVLKGESLDLEGKIDRIDELSDLREQHLKLMQLLDLEIEGAREALTPEEARFLRSDEAFRGQLEKTLHLIKEIQLTDQSLFLYIQGTGSELRAQILKSLKEKEAVSKFKSQSQSPLGDEIDQTV
ncbi:hypothetical protein EB061_08180 [bacterium]|nr:hypothetical protein [bacterium]